jgi:hypothetical protein
MESMEMMTAMTFVQPRAGKRRRQRNWLTQELQRRKFRELTLIFLPPMIGLRAFGSRPALEAVFVRHACNARQDWPLKPLSASGRVRKWNSTRPLSPYLLQTMGQRWDGPENRDQRLSSLRGLIDSSIFAANDGRYSLPHSAGLR